jgi:hypothetical protein
MPDLREALLKQMRELRARLDPEVVERLRLAVTGKVPYDRDNARAAVNRFLAGRDDDGAFRDKLEAELKREGVDTAEALAEAPKPPPPPKRRRFGRLI